MWKEAETLMTIKERIKIFLKKMRFFFSPGLYKLWCSLGWVFCCIFFPPKITSRHQAFQHKISEGGGGK